MAFYRRSDLQAVAEAKLADALVLLDAGRFSNAYYLAGYAVEIGLKACIAKMIDRDVIPDKKFVLDIFQHDLQKLVGVAGLHQELKEKLKADGEFATNWALTAQWVPDHRYEVIDRTRAELTVNAIADTTSGVMPWIREYWSTPDKA